MKVDELRQRLREAGVIVPPSGLLPAKSAALVIGCKVATLDRWRQQGSGPRFVRLNGRYFFDIDELALWLTGDQIS